MAKVAITMTFTQAIASRFKTRLTDYGIVFSEKKTWETMSPGFKHITQVQYIVEDYFIAILEMNASMDVRERVNYGVEEYV